MSAVAIAPREAEGRDREDRHVTEGLGVDALIERPPDVGVDCAFGFRPGGQREFDQPFRLVVDGTSLRAGLAQPRIGVPDEGVIE